MSDLPRKAITRTARLAALPMGYAGRTALGFGKRLGGKPADAVLTEARARSATLGRVVTVTLAGEVVEGTATRLTAEGGR